MGAGRRSRKFRDHSLDHAQEADKANRKRSEPMNSQSLLPNFLSMAPPLPQTRPPTVEIYPNLWGPFVFQTAARYQEKRELKFQITVLC